MAGDGRPGYPCGQLNSDPRIPLLWPAWDTGIKELHDERTTL